MDTNSGSHNSNIVVRQRPIIDSRIERQIIIGMIVNEQFLRGVKQIYNGLETQYTNTVGNWCLEYLEKYNCAPGKNIEDIFQKNRGSIDDTTCEMIEKFLEDISDEYSTYEGFNTERLLDNAEEYFNLCALNKFNTEIKQDIIGRRIDEANLKIKEYKRIERQKAGTSLLLDPNVIVSAFESEETDSLFCLPGDLGRMVGSFNRGQLSAFVGNSSIGKSWWLQLCAMTALFSGLKVLFVSLEMSQNEMVKRIQQYFTGLPIYDLEYLLIPIMDCKWNQNNSCRLEARTCRVGILDADGGGRPPSFNDANKEYVVCTECRGEKNFEFASWFKKVNREKLTAEHALKKLERLKRANILRSIENFRYIEYPSGKVKASQMVTQMGNLEYYENWVADVLITDYADKFQPERSREKRFELEQIWEMHKAIAQERHMHVMSGSQSNTVRTETDVRQGSWQEAIQKLQLVDVAFALNQKPEEQELGCMRVSVLKHRHNRFSLNREVKVLQSYAIGRPYLDSYAGRRDNNMT